MAFLTHTEDWDFNFKDSSKVISIFKKGETADFRQEFIAAIKKDMECIDYRIEEVGTASLKVMVSGKDNQTALPVGLYVKETDLDDVTDQHEISQDMFRALSLIIQLNYSLLAKIPSCILIDDIGEGLDYDRSKKLIDLIIQKAKKSAVQLIMTTNDRFVMNKTPLEYWSVIKREKNRSIFYNYRNAKERFEEFAYTGLNNFDFFACDFYIHGFETEMQ